MHTWTARVLEARIDLSVIHLRWHGEDAREEQFTVRMGMTSHLRLENDLMAGLDWLLL